MSFDPAPEKSPEGAADRWIATLFAGAFVGLVAAGILDGFEPRKLSAVFIPALWVPLLVIHEFGHALVAKACGWRVERIVLGFGATLKRFHVGGARIDLKMFPISGYVLPRPTHLRRPQLRNALIYAGGPLLELLAILVVACAIGFDRLLSQSDSIPVIAAQSFCVAGLLGLFFTLWPHDTTSGGGVSWSDGKGILWSWKLPDAYFSKMLRRKPS